MAASQGKILLTAAILVAVLTLMFNGLARAADQPTPQAQAMSQRLMQEINANLQCSTAAIELGQQLEHSKAELARLLAKYEPTKPEAPKK